MNKVNWSINEFKLIYMGHFKIISTQWVKIWERSKLSSATKILWTRGLFRMQVSNLLSKMCYGDFLMT